MAEVTTKRTALHLFNAIRDARVAKGAQLTLLFVLATRADPQKSFSCFPSLHTLAADAGMSTSAVQRAARELEKKGLIYRVVRCNSSTRYQVCFDAIVGLADLRKAESGPDAYETVFDPETDQFRSDYAPAWGVIGTLGKSRFGPDFEMTEKDCVKVILKIHRLLRSLDDAEVEGIKAWIESGEATVLREKVERCTTPVAVAYAFAKHHRVIIQEYWEFVAQRV